MTNKAEHLLEQQLAELPNSIQPQRDLWAGIDHAIESELATENRDSRSWLATAAAVLMVAGLGWFGLQPSADYPQPLGEQLVSQLSTQHSEQKNALLASYQGQQVMIDDWQLRMSELDDAAKAIKEALNNSPNNQALLQMLQSIYRQQIELIEKAYQPRYRQI